MEYTGHANGLSSDGKVLTRDIFQSSWAVDKGNTDQEVVTSETTLLTAERKLWDLRGDYDLENSAFTPAVDGLWVLDGTIRLTDCVNVQSAQIDVYRDGELWFTVAAGTPDANSSVVLPFVCMMDCFVTEEHVFDLRVKLNGTDPSATVSGSDEETAWGMTFQHFLSNGSVTG